VISTATPADSAGGASVVTDDTYTPDGQLATQTVGYGTSAAATTSYCYDSQDDETAVVMPDGNTSGTAPCETSPPWTDDPSAYAGSLSTREPISLVPGLNFDDGVPPVGFEPTHPAPEAGALSPELRGLKGDSERLPVLSRRLRHAPVR
jgi:hypothetical protein